MTQDVTEWSIDRSDFSMHDLQNLLANVMAGNEDVEDCMKRMVPVLESQGCETEFHCKYPGWEERSSTAIEVLSLDLAWLRPGPFGSWSEQGQQACLCVAQPGNGRPGPTGWYDRALQKFFSSNNCRSLLTYPHIYSRQSFIHLSKLADLPGSRAGKQVNVQRPQTLAYQTWRTTFHPERGADQTAHQWTQRFEDFRTALRDELATDLGIDSVSDALLIWVYASPGMPIDSDVPPPWAASLFMVFRFPSGAPTDRDLDLLVSNLVHALQSASQATLPAQRKHDMAQALAHEFKNLNQDVALMSDLVLDEFRRFRARGTTPEIDAIHQRLAALDVAAQASTAISTAAYWFVAHTKGAIEFRADEEASAIFRHVLYLAMRVVAAKHETWTLKDIPELGAIMRFLDRHLQQNSRGSATNLLSNRCTSLMLFFALEPVRNIRAEGGAGAEVELSVESEGNDIVLVQRSEQRGDAIQPVRSRTVAALMEMARDHPSTLGGFIHIDPNVTTTLIPTGVSGVFVAERRTAIRVQKVPFLMY